MSNKVYNYWEPVVRSLLWILWDECGCDIVAVDNDGDEGFVKTNSIKDACEEICAVDSAYLAVKTPEGKQKTLFIVLDGSPEEIVADYHVDDTVNKAVDMFCDSWEGKSVPKYVRDPTDLPEKGTFGDSITVKDNTFNDYLYLWDGTKWALIQEEI